MLTALLLASDDPESHVLPHAFFKLIDGWNFNFGVDNIPLLNIHFGPKSFYFTNHLLMTLMAAGLCLLIFPIIARRYRSGGREPIAPRGVTNLIESIMQFVRQGVAEPVLGHRTDQYMPFLWTMFFFILFCNLLGLIPLDPIIYLISGRTVQHIGGTATGNMAITGGLALCSFGVIHVAGIREVFRGLIAGTYGHHDHGDEQAEADHHGSHGHGRQMAVGQAAVMAAPLYVWNFAPHVFSPGADATPAAKLLLSIADVLMWAFLLLLEGLGAIIKPFALTVRLFANMIAGHIVLASLLGLIFILGKWLVVPASVLGCVAISCLELFVAFLQAYIFVFLSTLFIGAAVAPEH